MPQGSHGVFAKPHRIGDQSPEVSTDFSSGIIPGICLDTGKKIGDIFVNKSGPTRNDGRSKVAEMPGQDPRQKSRHAYLMA